MKSILTRKEGAILIKKLNPRQIAEKWKKVMQLMLVIDLKILRK